MNRLYCFIIFFVILFTCSPDLYADTNAMNQYNVIIFESATNPFKHDTYSIQNELDISPFFNKLLNKLINKYNYRVEKAITSCVYFSFLKFLEYSPFENID